eukprot:TRINITY_DN13423_c0_g2_i1.p1 TRINITY_DN13423_c0_g2~~TRINITY_DN13423_c0_g2_i1.p1  ORF type:complete len:442 (+),score=69.77 TRINITY_DN13423_c0_g2_i1:49-1374(+)
MSDENWGRVESEVIQDEATEHAECSICLEDLCCEELAPVCVLATRGKRVCRHFYHKQCANLLTSKGTEKCPCCRANFKQVMPLPDPFTDIHRWFELVDMDRRKSLTKVELADVISASLAVDHKKIPDLIDKHWESWDADGSGAITMPEIQNLLPFLKKYLPARVNNPPPFLPDDPMKWFEYWDLSCSGELTKPEVARGVAKTLEASVDQACEIIDGIWCLFDITKSNTITRKEFIRPGGLSETLCAALGVNKQTRPRVAKALIRTSEPVDHSPVLPSRASHPFEIPENADRQTRTERVYLGSRVYNTTTQQVGVAIAVTDDTVTIERPSTREEVWNRSEIVILSSPDISRIEVGSRVQIDPTLFRPRYGWGLLSDRTQVGFVVQFFDDIHVCVSFPEQDRWNGIIGELVLAAAPAGSRTCRTCTFLNPPDARRCEMCREYL